MTCPKHLLALLSLLVSTGGIFTACGGVGGGNGYNISGIVTFNGAGFGGVTITLWGNASEAATTDSEGRFSFSGLEDGEYTVTPSLVGQTLTPSSRDIVLFGSSMAGVDFILDTYALSGRVILSELGYPGASVALSGDWTASDTTDSAGEYSFQILNGTYTVTPSVDGQTLTPSDLQIIIGSADSTGNDFILDTWEIAGLVTLNGSGFEGAMVQLTGDASESIITEEAGTFAFTVLNGSYTLTPFVTSQTFSPAGTDLIVSGSDAPPLEFAMDTYEISGQLTNNLGPMAGIDVDLTGFSSGSTKTDNFGNYTFPGLLNGSYTVTPACAPQAFSPASSQVSLFGANHGNVDFHAPSMVWVVDIEAVGTEDGFTWANAFNHPQDAMDIAFPGDQVWVAQGIYFSRDSGDIYVLSLNDGVAIYGGFSGIESELWQRNWGQNVTVLDGNDFPYIYEDCHVVIANADNAFLDGFTITGGSDSGGSSYSGNGIHISNSKAINSSFSNCSVTQNYGLMSVPSIFIETSQDSEITFTGCEISENFGVWILAGGVAIRSGNVTLTGCDIINNSANEGTGGISIDSDADVTIKRSRIENNACEAQGGVGGISNSGNLSLINSIIYGNIAGWNGLGGGIDTGGPTFLYNSTVVNNQAGGYERHPGGGGIYVEDASIVEIVNSVLWRNTGYENYLLVDSQIEGVPESVTYSDIMGGWAGTGNIDSDPDFWSANDFRLESYSPCIDTGTSEGAPSEDIEGTPRPQGAGYDMGAYEYVP